jgi:hypothetical protein
MMPYRVDGQGSQREKIDRKIRKIGKGRIDQRGVEWRAKMRRGSA